MAVGAKVGDGVSVGVYVGLSGLMRTVGVGVNVASTVVVASVWGSSLHAAITTTESMASTTAAGDHLKNVNIAHSVRDY